VLACSRDDQRQRASWVCEPKSGAARRGGLPPGPTELQPARGRGRARGSLGSPGTGRSCPWSRPKPGGGQGCDLALLSGSNEQRAQLTMGTVEGSGQRPESTNRSSLTDRSVSGQGPAVRWTMVRLPPLPEASNDGMPSKELVFVLLRPWPFATTGCPASGFGTGLSG